MCPRGQIDADRLLAPLVVPDLIDQPGGQLHQVGAGALLPAGQLPDLGAVPLGGPRGEVVRRRPGGGDADLAGDDVLDRIARQLQPHLAEPAAEMEHHLESDHQTK
jgi:hypothetical protein